MTAVAETNFTASRMIVVGLLPFDQDLAGFVQVAGNASLNGAGSSAHYLPPSVTRSLLGAFTRAGLPSGRQVNPRSDRLTARERQVVDRISEGLSNKQIATRLGIAIHTVKCHVHNILAKLEVDNRVQVAVFGRSGEHVSWGPELVQA